jgi:hypothetical protein
VVLEAAQALYDVQGMTDEEYAARDFKPGSLGARDPEYTKATSPSFNAHSQR